MPSSHRFVTLDVFTSTAFGGNQLAVFPDASGIPEEALIRITREFNFSEVTFCYPPTNPAHTRRVRIFTPGKEVPFAGHPTVGTAIALHLLGQGGGARRRQREARARRGGGPGSGHRHARQTALRSRSSRSPCCPRSARRAPSRGMLAELLSIEPEDIQASPSAPQNVSCGLPFLMVPLRSVDAVSRARVRVDKFEATLKSRWAPEIFVFAKKPEGDEAHVHARMFAPGINISEDPATGSANACLAGYLAARAPQKDGTLAWTVDQGIEMGRPSRLEIEADKSAGAITAIRVGGNAVMVSEGTLTL